MVWTSFKLFPPISSPRMGERLSKGTKVTLSLVLWVLAQSQRIKPSPSSCFRRNGGNELFSVAGESPQHTAPCFSLSKPLVAWGPDASGSEQLLEHPHPRAASLLCRSPLFREAFSSFPASPGTDKSGRKKVVTTKSNFSLWVCSWALPEEFCRSLVGVPMEWAPLSPCKP